MNEQYLNQSFGHFKKRLNLRIIDERYKVYVGVKKYLTETPNPAIKASLKIT
jgi:hypothetical protein